MSDLHLPNYRGHTVEQAVAALIAARVRLVVITGDHTNGSVIDGRRRRAVGWWRTVREALAPLHAAGIAVLPVAGNHDTYMAWHREGYAAAFADLARWAEPFTIHPAHGRHFARPPFAYSVDVDGVHLALAHVVSQYVDRDVAAWLAADLAAATTARHRIVFGHVPIASVIQPPRPRFVRQLGGILERGNVDLYVAGHEHLVWDEDVALPDGGRLRQILVGCSSGFYNFGPSPASARRARCTAIRDPKRVDPVRCAMPNGGGQFELARGRKRRHVQHAANSFTVFTVDGDRITAEPMTIDAGGHPRPFYLAQTADLGSPTARLRR